MDWNSQSAMKKPSSRTWFDNGNDNNNNVICDVQCGHMGFTCKRVWYKLHGNELRASINLWKSWCSIYNWIGKWSQLWSQFSYNRDLRNWLLKSLPCILRNLTLSDLLQLKVSETIELYFFCKCTIREKL